MPRFKSVKAVLFDLDGTLLDSAPDLGVAANTMRTVRNLPPLPLWHYRRAVGSGARGLLAIALDITPEHHEFEAMREEFFATYEQGLTRNTRPFVGVNRLLEQLQAEGLAWGVVTNKMERFVQPMLQAMHIFSTAKAVVAGDTTPYSKPHPEPLLEAARRLDIAPQYCLYVGDDVRDIQAGRAAGMFTVAARYGYLPPEDHALDWGADAFIDLPLDLLALVR